MRLSDVQITIEPRSLHQCVDLAGAYLRVHWWRVYGCAALFAVPSVTAIVFLSAGSAWALGAQLLTFVFVSRFAGAVLVGCVGPNIFGAPLSVVAGLRVYAKRAIGLSASLVFTVFAVVLLLGFGFVPGLLIAAASPFVPEVALLERLSGRRARARQKSLISGEYTTVLVHLLYLLILGGFASLSLFFAIDALAGVVLETPVFVNRVVDYASVGAFWALFSDGLVATTLAVCVWLVYPWLRIAWFFSYLDFRIRREGWDLELDLRREVQRWDGVRA